MKVVTARIDIGHRPIEHGLSVDLGHELLAIKYQPEVMWLAPVNTATNV
jgi:hypothetical protein